MMRIEEEEGDALGGASEPDARKFFEKLLSSKRPEVDLRALVKKLNHIYGEDVWKVEAAPCLHRRFLHPDRLAKAAQSINKRAQRQYVALAEEFKRRVRVCVGVFKER